MVKVKKETVAKTAKRIVETAIVLLCLRFIVWCVSDILFPRQEPPNTDHVQVVLSESQRFTQQELADAAQTVIDNFGLNGCVLLDLWYDEEFSEMVRSSRSYNIESDYLVLRGRFYVLPKGASPAFDGDRLYSNWSWRLAREDGDSPWTIKGSGFA